MTKILYGIAGEGLGHAFRSSIVIDELKKENEIKIVTSGKVYELLKNKYENVIEIPGFFMNIKNNQLMSSTAIKNLNPFLKNRTHTKNLLEKIINDFKPEIILNDFEPYLSWTAKRIKTPHISIDNINTILRTDANLKDFPWHLKQAAKITTKLFSPHSDYFFIPSFFPIKTRKENISIVNPLIRPELFKYGDKTMDKNYFIVYQSTDTNKNLITELKKTSENFIVYGFNKEDIDKNIIFKKFSKEKFLEDLVNSKGIITNGGFTLISEALYLNKPILSEPIKNHYEQNLNSHYLKKMNLGESTSKISSEQINDFSNNLEFYKKNSKKINFDNNKTFFKKLKNKIDELKK